MKLSLVQSSGGIGPLPPPRCPDTIERLGQRRSPVARPAAFACRASWSISLPMAPTPPIPRVFDTLSKDRQRSRAAAGVARYCFLKARVSSDLVERLGDSPRAFPCALDLGCHDGTLSRALLEGGQVRTCLALDPVPAMAGQAHGSDVLPLVGETERLPFAPRSVDLVASTLCLHWVNDLPGLMVQVREALKPDGLFLAALFGAGTLGELRTALIEAETELTGGASPRISPLPGLQDMAGLLQRTGFAMPVADVETITVRYGSPLGLVDDLRGMGEQAAFAEPGGRSLSRRILARMAEIYQARFADPDGRVRASFEVIWLSGWAPGEGQPTPLRPGSAKVSLADALGTQERSAGERAGRAGDDHDET